MMRSKGEFSMDFLKKSLGTVTEIMDQSVQNDLNFDGSSKAICGILVSTIAC